jgi:hypothetical protein
MATRISATKAVRSFSGLLNRVKYRGESFIVEHNREAMCRIKPMRRGKSGTTETFGEFWESLPRPLPGRGNHLLIGPYDLIIAATVLAHRIPLATSNDQEFRKVKGLEVLALRTYLRP